MGKLYEIIAAQQKGHENEPIFMIGEQLKDIARNDPKAAELLEHDLETPGMGLADAAKKLKEYSDKNRGKATCFCITPNVAEKILREFYGLGPAPTSEAPKPTAQVPTSHIDLSDFL